MEPRLASGVWVAAYLARLRLAAVPAFVMQKGDATAGAVVVKVATLDGKARAFQRRFDFATDRRIWDELVAGEEARVDEVLRRERGRDRDLWIIEIEDRQGRSLLEEEGLAD